MIKKLNKKAGDHIKPWDNYELDDIIEYGSGDEKCHLIIDKRENNNDYQFTYLMVFYDRIYKEAVLYSISFDLYRYMDPRFLHIEIYKKYKGISCISNIIKYLIKNNILDLYYEKINQDMINVEKYYQNCTIYSYKCHDSEKISHNNLYHIKYMMLYIINNVNNKYNIFEDNTDIKEIFKYMKLYCFKDIEYCIKIKDSLLVLTYNHLYRITKCKHEHQYFIEKDEKDINYEIIKYDNSIDAIVKILKSLNVNFIIKDNYIISWSCIYEYCQICFQRFNKTIEKIYYKKIPKKIFESNKDIIINTFIEEIEEEIEKEKK